jgi:hypothetical protein
MPNATWIDFTTERVLITYVNIVLNSEMWDSHELSVQMSN